MSKLLSPAAYASLRNVLLLLAVFLVSGSEPRRATASPPEPSASKSVPSAEPDNRAAVPNIPTFQHDVLPVLQAKCVKCHGAEKKNAGLDLRTLASVLAGGNSGSVLAPGNPDQSLLWQQIMEREMPPKGQEQLTEAERALIRQWIAKGKLETPAAGASAMKFAVTDEHRQYWAFKRPVKPPVPEVQRASQVATPVDAFVLQKLEIHGLRMNPEANRQTLIRRAYFDLIGLPPTPAEIDKFVNDSSSEAFAKVVSDLLDSPHYGERWARHWLDSAGYADSNGGIGPDNVRHSAWRYRDYVIRSLNADKPYDQFVREQLAGDELVDWRNADELTPDMVEKLTATGFIRCAQDGSRGLGKNIPDRHKEVSYNALFTATDVAMNALIGLSVGCERCHNHKFDPIGQADYYRILACFRPAYDPEDWVPANEFFGVPDGWVLRYLPESGRPLAERERLAAKHQELLAQRRERNQKVFALAQPLQDAGYKIRTSGRIVDFGPDKLDAKAQAIADQIRQLEKERFEIQAQMETVFATRSTIWALWDVTATPPPETQLLKGGSYATPGDAIAPGPIEVLDDASDPFPFPSLPDAKLGTSGRRRALAEWLTQPDHPLSARVIVNKVWRHHFGRGIVPSTDEFGAKGDPPSHPELLDWLAVTLVENGWSLKKLHRLILLSSVYRQSADADAERLAQDPANELLWWKTPLRLEAESIRDAVLQLGGALDLQMFGPPVGVRKTADGQFIDDTQGPAGQRRSIYLLTRRRTPVSLLTTFDSPIMDTNVPRRFNSATAPQSLAQLNNPLLYEMARRFARRVADTTNGDRAAQIQAAFQMALSRAPDAGELADLSAFLDAQTGAASDSDAALASLCHVLFGLNEFLYAN